MPEAVAYLHLLPESELPELSLHPVLAAPFRVVLMAEATVSAQWQAEVSDWLVRSGCLYLMAWGCNCSSWNDSVDEANIEMFEPSDIPADRFVLTTWHENEALSEVFWFAKHCAEHAQVPLPSVLLLHLASTEREQALWAEYTAA